jgi:precorrin-6B methylase 1
VIFNKLRRLYSNTLRFVLSLFDTPQNKTILKSIAVLHSVCNRFGVSLMDTHVGQLMEQWAKGTIESSEDTERLLAFMNGRSRARRRAFELFVHYGDLGSEILWVSENHKVEFEKWLNEAPT